MTRMTGPDCVVMCNLINTYIHTYIHTSLIPPREDQCEWHRMTRMTGPDCVVMCNLINTYIHTYIPIYIHKYIFTYKYDRLNPLRVDITTEAGALFDTTLDSRIRHFYSTLPLSTLAPAPIWGMQHAM